MTETGYLYQYFLEKSEEESSSAQNIPEDKENRTEKRDKKAKVKHESKP